MQRRLTPTRVRHLDDDELLACARYLWDHFSSRLANALLAEIERRGLNV